jgi:hypothetical protein
MSEMYIDLLKKYLLVRLDNVILDLEINEDDQDLVDHYIDLLDWSELWLYE